MKAISTFVLLTLLFVSAAVAQRDDRWVVVPNIDNIADWNVTPSSPALAKVIGDTAEYVLRWKVPGSAADWRLRRPQVELAVRRSVGLERLPERTPLNARVLASHDRGDYVVENLVFESRPGFPVTANLYRPKSPAAARMPGVVCPIGHNIRDGKTVKRVQSRSIMLAKMGFVVLAYDAIGHGERNLPGNSHMDGGFALLPLGESITGWMVWDSMRAIDYLQSRPDVDGSRIGVTGNSGGGLNTLYTAAIDKRVTAAAVVGFTFEFNNWIKYGGPHCACTYLPGLQEVEWFEIAGLIAPRAVLMLNGERDRIFPVSGARKAGYSVEALYSVLGHGDRARLYIVPEQGHAYSLPYREQMYGWMAKHLLSEGDGGWMAEEEDVEPLPAGDPQLLCDPEETWMPGSPSVVDLARERGLTMARTMATEATNEARAGLMGWVKELTSPPDSEPHNLMPIRVEKSEGGGPEKVYFVSEIGQFVPGLLWKPRGSVSPRRTIIVVDEAGKGAFAESGWVEPLREAGNAVLAIDTRGRGETMGVMGERDNNYQMLSMAIMAGRPVAGRRAFDLSRAIDYVSRRGDLPLEDLTVLGRGDDALVGLLAATVDSRIQRVVAAGYVHSFVSQIVAAQVTSREDLIRKWNSMAHHHGRLEAERYTVDMGAVIPGSLEHGDLADIVTLLDGRKVLYCGMKDHDTPEMAPMRERFLRVTKAARQSDGLTYEPEEALTAERLLGWLGI